MKRFFKNILMVGAVVAMVAMVGCKKDDDNKSGGNNAPKITGVYFVNDPSKMSTTFNNPNLFECDQLNPELVITVNGKEVKRESVKGKVEKNIPMSFASGASVSVVLEFNPIQGAQFNEAKYDCQYAGAIYDVAQSGSINFHGLGMTLSGSRGIQGSYIPTYVSKSHTIATRNF